MAKNHDIVSVIVPVYNVEAYLSRCLDSILSQTYRELEILLIDDGSTDASPQICDHYARQDPRIQVIHQENKGLSGARNAGIDRATGLCFLFVDADDMIAPTMVERLWEVMQETGADIVQCDVWGIDSREGIYEEYPLSRGCEEHNVEVFSGRASFLELYRFPLLAVVQWNKLFKAKIFQKLRYPEGRLHEDEFVILDELERANKVAYCAERLYTYFLRSDSISGSSINTRRTKDIIDGLANQFDFFVKKKDVILAEYAWTRLHLFFDEIKVKSEEERRFIEEERKRQKKRYHQYCKRNFLRGQWVIAILFRMREKCGTRIKAGVAAEWLQRVLRRKSE